MPPKSKISREMVIDAAFEIVRESGEAGMNARTIAEKLNCSTQPVLYVFRTMDEIREMVYRKVDEYHSKYLMQMSSTDTNPINSLWKNYIRFSVEEKNFFKFLFQSNAFSGRTQELIEDERLLPVLIIMSDRMSIPVSEVKKCFAALYYPVHGIASLLANNSMEYNEKELEETMNMILRGVIDGRGMNSNAQ